MPSDLSNLVLLRVFFYVGNWVKRLGYFYHRNTDCILIVLDKQVLEASLEQFTQYSSPRIRHQKTAETSLTFPYVRVA